MPEKKYNSYGRTTEWCFEILMTFILLKKALNTGTSARQADCRNTSLWTFKPNRTTAKTKHFALTLGKRDLPEISRSGRSFLGFKRRPKEKHENEDLNAVNHNFELRAESQLVYSPKGESGPF